MKRLLSKLNHRLITPAVTRLREPALEGNPEWAQSINLPRVELGNTGISVSVAGLGTGGLSKLGRSQGHSRRYSVRLIQQALASGVNLLDTAEGYGTEHLVASAISGMDRDAVVLSTKHRVAVANTLVSGSELKLGLERSLQRLNTDHVDLYHLHAVRPEHYPHVKEHLIPVMRSLREQGKIRAIGISEAFEADPQHTMLENALQDKVWEVVMLGFNHSNVSARETVLPQATNNNVGVIGMFAVRHASLLARETPTASLADAVASAYTFARDEPGIQCVLFGTGHSSHLRANLTTLSHV